MKTIRIALTVLTAGVLGSVNGYAQSTDIGKSEYEGSCAVCHGTLGEANGPYAAFMGKVAVVNLTTLTKNNNGVFPFQRVYDTIDGRKMVKAHGESDMPIWGRRFIPSKGAYNPYDPDYNNPEAMVRGRILALTEYVNRLQK